MTVQTREGTPPFDGEGAPPPLPPPLPPPIPDRAPRDEAVSPTRPVRPKAVAAMTSRTRDGGCLWLGATVGAATGLVAGILLLLGVASVGDRNFPNTAAESRFYAELAAWVAIVLTAVFVALGPRAIGSVAGSLFLGAVVLGRSLARNVGDLKGFRAESAPPGLGSVVLAVAIGGIAGMAFVSRRAHDRRNAVAVARKPHTATPTPGGGR